MLSKQTKKTRSVVGASRAAASSRNKRRGLGSASAPTGSLGHGGGVEESAAKSTAEGLLRRITRTVSDKHAFAGMVVNRKRKAASRTVRAIMAGRPIEREDLEVLFDSKLTGFGGFLCFLVLVYFYYLLKAERMLHEIQEKNIVQPSHPFLRNTQNTNDNGNNSGERRMKIDDIDMSKISTNDHFIIFRADRALAGQGAGNIVSGLLSAHLLGEEFDRIVCIDYLSSQFNSFGPNFLQAFEPIQQSAKEKCPVILQLINLDERSKQNKGNNVRLLTYGKPPNECKVRDIMEDTQNHPIIYLSANTYPRWPSVPDGFFFKFYKPTLALMNILPYNKDGRQVMEELDHPKTVVHLRWPDNPIVDFRAGLDPATLQALGELLPHDTYVVSNKIALFEIMETKFHWRHPDWTHVRHSGSGIVWDAVDEEEEDESFSAFLSLPGRIIRAIFRIHSDEDPLTAEEFLEERRLQNLQLWADWYTILQATEVYHVSSDFSLSAIHWVNNKNTFTIDSYNKEADQMVLKREPWLMDGESIPLSQRIKPDGDALMKTILEKAQKPKDIENEHPEYMRKCFANIYRAAIKEKRKRLGIIKVDRDEDMFRLDDAVAPEDAEIDVEDHAFDNE